MLTLHRTPQGEVLIGRLTFRSLLVSCATALLAMNGCKVSVAKRNTEQFIPVAKGTRVEVDISTANRSTGNISVEAGRLGMVSLRTYRKALAVWSAEAKLKNITVKATKDKGLLRIVGKSPASDSSQKYRMHLKLTVPPKTHLVLKTGNGHIKLNNLRGDVKATTQRGELRARAVTGRVILSTGEGNITLRGAPRQFQVRTRLGEVQVWLRPETQLTGKNEARTEAGALTLHASTKLNALVTAQAKGGAIKSVFPTAGKKKHWAQVRLGRGGPTISLFCQKGSLQLKKW